MDQITLISSPTCPYVQRAVIALAERGCPHEVKYVDLQNKPDWFLAISPLGKVPVLQVAREGQADAIVFESMVIVEYLEDVLDAKLHPADPLARAQHRSWMEFCNAMLGDLRGLFTAADDEQLAKAGAVLAGKAQRLEAVVKGPLFAGEAFCNVDAVYASMFRQLDLLERVSGRTLFASPPKVTAWRHALAARPSVRGAVPADYEERFLSRMRAMGASLLKQAA